MSKNSLESIHWKTAGKVAGKVLGTSSRWEHWVWTFAQAGQFDAITPYIPTKQLHPPLPSIVYEMVLGNYIIGRYLSGRLYLLHPPVRRYAPKEAAIAAAEISGRSKLYHRGIERLEWTQTKFWSYMINGLYQSLMVFYMVYMIFFMVHMIGVKEVAG
ncbi:hypothetical protein IWZ00DRAFT_567467 [Phyllosticta capitalensis]